MISKLVREVIGPVVGFSSDNGIDRYDQQGAWSTEFHPTEESALNRCTELRKGCHQYTTEKMLDGRTSIVFRRQSGTWDRPGDHQI